MTVNVALTNGETEIKRRETWIRKVRRAHSQTFVEEWVYNAHIRRMLVGILVNEKIES